MCRNIRVLHNFAPPTTPEEIRAAALQYVRKVGGIQKVNPADEKIVQRAVDEVTRATEKLLAALPARGAVRTREGEKERARVKWQMREARIQRAPLR
jgi:hypothetical protein